MKRLLLIGSLFSWLLMGCCQSSGSPSAEGRDTIKKADSLNSSTNQISISTDSNLILADSVNAANNEGIEALTPSQKKRWKELEKKLKPAIDPVVRLNDPPKPLTLTPEEQRLKDSVETLKWGSNHK